MKPIEIIVYALNNSSKKWELVLDVFWGSWSTLIACEKTARRCCTMELDPKYAQVIIQRYYDYTKGKKTISCLNRKIKLKDHLSLS
jgi:DNA modification methylase